MCNGTHQGPVFNDTINGTEVCQSCGEVLQDHVLTIDSYMNMGWSENDVAGGWARKVRLDHNPLPDTPNTRIYPLDNIGNCKSETLRVALYRDVHFNKVRDRATRRKLQIMVYIGILRNSFPNIPRNLWDDLLHKAMNLPSLGGVGVGEAVVTYCYYWLGTIKQRPLLESFLKLAQIDYDAFSRCRRFLIREGIVPHAWVRLEQTPDEILQRTMSQLNLCNPELTRAYAFLKRVYRRGVEKRHIGALLWVLNRKEITQSQVAQILSCTEMTVRKGVREIKKYLEAYNRMKLKEMAK